MHTNLTIVKVLWSYLEAERNVFSYKRQSIRYAAKTACTCCISVRSSVPEIQHITVFKKKLTQLEH